MVRQAKRRAHKQGTLTLQSTTTADGASLAKFYAAERASWKGKNGTAIASDPALRRFHDEVAPAAEHVGYFRLYLLDLSGAKIAGLYSFEFNQRPFRNQRIRLRRGISKASAWSFTGQLCLTRLCRSRHIREFDFLGPWMEWKADWTDRVRPHS
jgi:hypothetical protein